MENWVDRDFRALLHLFHQERVPGCVFVSLGPQVNYITLAHLLFNMGITPRSFRSGRKRVGPCCLLLFGLFDVGVLEG